MKKILCLLGLFFLSGCDLDTSVVTHQFDNSVEDAVLYTDNTVFENTVGKFKMEVDFLLEENFPEKFTCNGKDILPGMKFNNIPKGTKSLSIIMEDPDAEKVVGKVWDHFLLANIEIDGVNFELEEDKIPFGTVIGKNSFGENKRNGPCPPDGRHQYVLKVYALNDFLDLRDGFSKDELLSEMSGLIITEDQISFYYDKK